MEQVTEAALDAGWLPHLAQRLGSSIEVDDAGCWIWIGKRNDARGGYGHVGVRIDNAKWKKVYTHRLIYELLVGPIDEGLVLDHLCRVPACVNPQHLEPVTQAENIARGRSPRNLAHRAGTCERGHVDDFCRRPDGRVVYCRACRRERRAS
jgi:hypothetical protein